MEFIPEGYRFDVAINYMAKMVYDDRADTLRNALDRFDEQMHRWKMENAQEEFLKIQALQLKQLNDLKAISFATGVGVWMNN